MHPTPQISVAGKYYCEHIKSYLISKWNLKWMQMPISNKLLALQALEFNVSLDNAVPT